MPVPKGYKIDLPASQGAGQMRLPAGYTLDAPAQNFTANPNGEGVYQMHGGAGTVGVPFSRVQEAQNAGYGLVGDDAARFQKDQAYLPANRGPVSSFLKESGAPAVVDLAKTALSNIPKSVSTIVDAGRRVFAPNQPQRMSENPNPIIKSVGSIIDNSVDHFKAGVDSLKQVGLTPETRREFGRAVPIAGPAFDEIEKQHAAGNTAGMLGGMLGLPAGLLGPEVLKSVAKIAPAATEAAAEAAQDSGANRMQNFLAAAKKLPTGISENAGRQVLEEGPGTSFATNRPQLTTQIDAARTASAPAIDAAAQASPGRLPFSRIKQAVDSTIDPMKEIASGPGSAQPSLPARLESLRQTFEPGISQAGDISAADALELRRQLDRQIDWNRGPDAVDATVRNAQRQIRGKVNAAFYDIAPEVREPSQRYANLSDAQELSEANEGARDVRYGSLPRTFVDAVVGTGVGAATHNPAAGAMAAAGTNVMPMLWKLPAVQTGVATGMFQAGKALKAATPFMQRIATGAEALDSLPRGTRFAAPAAGSATSSSFLMKPSPQGEGEHDDQQDTQGNRDQSAPPGGASSVLPPARKPFSSPVTDPPEPVKRSMLNRVLGGPGEDEDPNWMAKLMGRQAVAA